MDTEGRGRLDISAEEFGLTPPEWDTLHARLLALVAERKTTLVLDGRPPEEVLREFIGKLAAEIRAARES